MNPEDRTRSLTEPEPPKNRKERRASVAAKAKKRVDGGMRKKLGQIHRRASKLMKLVRGETAKKLDASVEDFFAPKKTG